MRKRRPGLSNRSLWFSARPSSDEDDGEEGDSEGESDSAALSPAGSEAQLGDKQDTPKHLLPWTTVKLRPGSRDHLYDVQNLVHDVVGALNDRTAVEEHMNRLAMDRLGHGPAYDKWVKNGPQRPKQIWDEQSLPSRVRDEDLLEHVSVGGQERFVKVAELLEQQEKEWCSTIFYGRSEADRKREEKKRDDAWRTRFSTMTGARKQWDQKGTPQFEADEEVDNWRGIYGGGGRESDGTAVAKLWGKADEEEDVWIDEWQDATKEGEALSCVCPVCGWRRALPAAHAKNATEQRKWDCSKANLYHKKKIMALTAVVQVGCDASDCSAQCW